jgi:hypothetical protein
VILGQRHGDWKWTLNLTHSTEWSDHFHSAEGEVELSCGLARDLSRHWALGLELRDHSDLPDYSQWENMALYVGPVLSYRRAGWWATLAVMPQIAGWNFNENADGNSHLELVDHERLNVRLLFGIEF